MILPPIDAPIGGSNSPIPGSVISDFDARYILGLPDPLATFTCTSTRNVWGYNGDPSASNPPILISVPPGIQAIQGGRWIDTEAEGAVISSNIAANSGFDTDTDWNKGAGWSIGSGVASAVATDAAIYQGVATARQIFKVSWDVTVNSGGTTAAAGDTVGTAKSGTGSFSDYITMGTGVNIGVIGSGFTGSIDNLVIEAITPKFLTETTTGISLHPYTTESTPSGPRKLFTEFATYSAVAVLAGEQVAKQTTAGNWVYLTALTPGTAVSVTVTEADIGTDISDAGGFDWRVGGYATLHKGGGVLEPAATNKILQSEDLSDAAWSTSSCSIDSAVETYGALSLDRINVTAADDKHEVYTTAGVAMTANTDQALTAYVKDDGERYAFLAIISGGTSWATAVFDLNDGSTSDTSVGGVSGTVTSSSAEKLPNGLWRLQAMLQTDNASTTPVVGAAGSATPAYVTGQPSFLAVAGEDLLVGGVHMEESGFASSYIKTTTATVTRASATLSNTSTGILTSESGAGRIVSTLSGLSTINTLIGSYVDANNYILIAYTGGLMKLFTSNSGVVNIVTKAYTPTPGVPFVLEFYWTTAGKWLRAYSKGTDPSGVAWSTDADTDLVQLDTVFELGSYNSGTDASSGNHISCQLSDNKDDLNFL